MSMHMVPEGYLQVFPVYRWHGAEVEALGRLVGRMYENRRRSGPADDRYFFLALFRDQLQELAEVFRASRDEVVYVSRADRRLIEKIAGFLKRNPEIMEAGKTA